MIKRLLLPIVLAFVSVCALGVVFSAAPDADLAPHVPMLAPLEAFAPLLAHAQTISPTINRVCVPVSVSPSSSVNPIFNAYFTVPDDGRAYSFGYVFTNTNNKPNGFNVGGIDVYNPNGEFIAGHPWIGSNGAPYTYGSDTENMIPGQWRLYHEGNHNNPQTLALAVSICYLDLDPVPAPENCELLQLEQGVQTMAQVPFTATRYYSETLVGAVYNGPLGFLLGGFSINEFGDFDAVIGTGAWTYAEYTETFALTPTTYALNVDGAGGNSPYYPWLAIYGCASDIEPPPPVPLTCDLVEEPDFTVVSSTVWSLAGGATISNSLLSLPTPTARAEQVLSWTNSISQNVLYYAYITGTGTTTGSDTLALTLLGGGVNRVTVELTDTMGITVTIPVSNDLTFPSLILSVLTGSLEIDYICLDGPFSLDFVGEYYECLNQVVENGEFDPPGIPWDFANGGTYNQTSGNTWLPHIPSSTVGIYTGTAPAVGQTPLVSPPPEIGPNDYLIMQFEARATKQGEGGIAAVFRSQDIFDPNIMTTTYEVYQPWYVYQSDFSQFSGETAQITIAWFNDTGTYGHDQGVFLDNVCLFVSPDPITNPYRIGDEIFDASLPFSCFTVSEWLSDTLQLDFVGLEGLAETELSVWNPEDWVPWLAAKLYVYVGKPIICILIMIYNEYVLPTINAMLWAIRQPQRIINWLAAWGALMIDEVSDWLLWASKPVLFALAALGWFFALPFVVSLWLGGLLEWAWEGVLMALGFEIGSGQSWLVFILNFLIAAWNTFLPSVSIVLTLIMTAFMVLWNDYLVPYLSNLGGGFFGFISFVLSHLGLLGELIMFFLNTAWRLVLTVWEFVAGLGTMPLTFYYAFEGSVNGIGFEYIPQCVGDLDANQFCMILAGLQIVDVALSHSIVYPLVIVGIVIATFMVFWRHIWGLISFDFR